MSNSFSPAQSVSRREFLKRSAVLAGAGIAAPLVNDLALVSSTAHARSDDDYRALVCVFMYGGNDSMATFVPSDDASFQRLSELRGHLVPDRRSLLPLGRDDRSGREISFAPQLGGVKSIFDRGDLAVIANVGPLVAPMTKKMYDSIKNRPPQLFSHNDQQSTWQSSRPEGSTEGWAGRLGDLLLSENGDHSAFTCMSTAGHAVMMSGQSVSQFQVDPQGVVQLDVPFRSSALLDGLQEVMVSSDRSAFGAAYRDVTESGLRSAAVLDGAVVSEPLGFPRSPLGRQLDMVARLIDAGKNRLGMTRQVFFVGTGGFDTHAAQGTDHPGLLLDLDVSLTMFDDGLRRMGLSEAVTTFTASEFGRTITANASGTDHGWGAHHMVMGGAVAGGRIVGSLPEIDDDGADDVGRGRLLPSLSTAQYSGALASWMGADAGEVSQFIPGISRFDPIDSSLFGRGKLVSNDPSGPGGNAGGSGDRRAGLLGSTRGLSRAQRSSRPQKP